MKAAVMRRAGEPLQIEEVEISAPGPREVLVRVAAAGVCRSDLTFLEGKYPLPTPSVLGHEASGVVEQVGEDVRLVKPGDHVVACLSAYCGHCRECVTGRLNLCASTDTQRDAAGPARLGLGGRDIPQFLNLSAFAERMLIHEHACVAIRKDMPLDRAALLGCAVLTGVGAVINGSKVRPGETVAVLGCGAVGLAAINGAAIAGAGRIIAIDRNAAMEALARSFGATDFLAAGDDPARAVRHLTQGGVDHAFEAIGMARTVEQAFGMLRRGGTANAIGMIPVGETVNLPGSLFMGERRIQGSQMGSNRFPVDIPMLADFYMAGRLRLDEMIARRIRLDEINAAFDDLRASAVGRSIIVFEG